MIPFVGMKQAAKPVMTICCSANFYKQAVEMQDKFSKLFTVVIPETALVMKESNDYEVSHYKTWYGNEDDYPKKAERMRAHFEEVAKADLIFVLNYEKKGVQNYIGANTTMEMGLAFFMNKPIFILNELPENSPFEEEFKGMHPIILHGKDDDLPHLYADLNKS